MAGATRELPVNSSPAVASNAEGEEIEVLESTDVLPVAPEDVSTLSTQGPMIHCFPLSASLSWGSYAAGRAFFCARANPRCRVVVLS